jgi:hypothetical protein
VNLIALLIPLVNIDYEKYIMDKRKKIPNPRVNRKVLPPEELYTIDLETGKKIKKMVWCDYHKDWEWIADFYTESEAKAKHPNDVRNMCIAAWDLVKGKTNLDKVSVPRPKKEKSTASLVSFLI